jgi:hypothetical protein
MDKPKYIINSTVACAAFAFLLTFGFVWTSYRPQAPFTAFMEGLVIGLGAVLGKRLWQKWDGSTKSFSNNKPTPTKTDEEDGDELPIR